jgi:hypothetical protein
MEPPRRIELRTFSLRVPVIAPSAHGAGARGSTESADYEDFRSSADPSLTCSSRRNSPATGGRLADIADNVNELGFWICKSCVEAGATGRSTCGY